MLRRHPLPDGLLDASAIMRFLDELAGELPSEGAQHLVVMVGGALLAWRGLREATRDVDSGIRLDADILTASRRIARRLTKLAKRRGDHVCHTTGPSAQHDRPQLCDE